jgi:16S rRNA (guanine1207-N2)-methyltransferase
MIGQNFDLLQSHWFKKEVSLSWEGSHLTLAVAQELFSSHVVDAGSLLLLRSLDPESFADTGTCVDFGCGYGVLGLAFKSVKPGWDVSLIDRDALAVEFSEWNAQRLDIDVTCAGGLDVGGIEGPLDLVLWNVPGKAGADVLRRLTTQILDRLAVGGMLVLVVVHPLARDLEEVAVARSDIEIVHESAGPEHTIFHMKRASGEPLEGVVDAFAAGAFDREEVDVDTGLLEYRFLPVIGLPQYDGPDISTILLTDGIETAARTTTNSALCISPGQGHVPIYMRQRWPDVTITLVDRDLLALRASTRSIGEAMTVFAAADVDVGGNSFDLVTSSLTNQIRPPVMQHQLQRMIEITGAGSHVAIGGGSTEVSRFIALARKHPELRLRNRDKRKGFSAAVFERR